MDAMNFGPFGGLGNFGMAEHGATPASEGGLFGSAGRIGLLAALTPAGSVAADALRRPVDGGDSPPPGGNLPPPPPIGSPGGEGRGGLPGFPGVPGFPGGNLPGGSGGLGGVLFPPGFPGFPGFPPPPPPPPQPPPGQPVVPAEPPVFAMPPGLRRPPFDRPPFHFPPPVVVSKTATELARSAISNLSEAQRDVVQEAINAIKLKNLSPDALLDYLERKVRVGEVLNQLARTWSETTIADFADAFQMDRAKTDVMDAIVSIAILNDSQLDKEILGENLPGSTPQELLDNRVIVDQWPKGGTALNPPYVILVAVEYRAIAQAEDVVHSIVGALEDFQGVKLPAAAVQKLQ